MTRILSALLLACLAGPALAHDAYDEEAELAECVAGVARLREQASALPADDLSRRFAETDLRNALTEAEAGDVDECPILLDRVEQTLRNRPFNLRPGETLRGYGPDDPA